MTFALPGLRPGGVCPVFSKKTASVEAHMMNAKLSQFETLLIEGKNYPVYLSEIPEQWNKAARRNGFRIAARVCDRYHLALRCDRCGELTKTKAYVLKSCTPLCGPCLTSKHSNFARQAGLAMLRRDPSSHKWAFYRAPCSHEVRRQFGFVKRVARGEVNIRCETCHAERQQREASRIGWTLVGPDPQGSPNYRLYEHRCGHRQRLAQVNVRWGQCDCAKCGVSWAAQPSFIYVIAIEPPEGHPELIKLGFSKHPIKRLKHQLGLPGDTKAHLIRVVAMENGRTAMIAEKKVHGLLLARFPELVAPFEAYRDILNVTSEIYVSAALTEIHRLLDELETDQHAA
jgi:hypothetical protein